MNVLIGLLRPFVNLKCAHERLREFAASPLRRSIFVIVGSATLVAGCAERAAPLEPDNGRPLLDLTTSPTVPDAPCLLSKANAAPPPGFNRYVFAAPLLGDDCGVAWYMDNFPAPNILLPGYEFLRPYLAPDNRSSRFQYGTGNIQIGPNYMIFYQPIDVFASTSETYDDLVPGPFPPGPPEQHILAFDKSGLLLVDTIGGAVTVIRRRGIQNLTVYPAPPNPNGPYVAPDTFRYKRVYTISFRVDSTCPPSGDALLDEKNVRDGIRDAMASSLANGGVERGGRVWKMVDGSYKYIAAIDPSATPCGFSFTPVTPPAGAEYTSPSGLFHTHPSYTNDVVPAACGYPSGSYFDNGRNGGGSLKDWGTANSAPFVPVYAYSKDGTMYMLVPHTQPSPNMKNPNTWKPSGLGCFKR